MRLSVVLALHGSAVRLGEVLARLDPQLHGEVELLLVASARSDDAAAARAAMRERPGLRVVIADAGALVPTLWATGINAARGERVALSVAHLLPGPAWIAALLAADLVAQAGVGGPIIQGPMEDGRSWAMYLQRYAVFSPTNVTAGPCPQIAGDNALYDRTTLLEHATAWKHGFWEIEVHAALAASGHTLAFDHALVVEHLNAYSALTFAGQRIQHGLRYGRARATAMTPGRRLAYVALAPAIPWVFGRKILRRDLRSQASRRQLARALPWLALFLAAWAGGEAAGAHAAWLPQTSPLPKQAP